MVIKDNSAKLFMGAGVILISACVILLIRPIEKWKWLKKKL